MNYIVTYTGCKVDLANPRPEDIKLADIAHAMAGINRFTGHGDLFISDAQHCVLVSELVPYERAFWGLLHDAAEAYLGDVSSPLKALLRLYSGGGYLHGKPASVYDLLEERFHEAISARFGVPRQDVKYWDVVACLTERRDNGPHTAGGDEPWFGGEYVLPRAPLVPWTSARAKSVFLCRAEQLGIR